MREILVKIYNREKYYVNRKRLDIDFIYKNFAPSVIDLERLLGEGTIENEYGYSIVFNKKSSNYRAIIKEKIAELKADKEM